MSLTQELEQHSDRIVETVEPRNALAESGVERILSHLSEQLPAFPSVRKALLIGARARGNHKDRSDVDIAVSMPGAVSVEWDRLWSVVNQCPTLLRVNMIRLDTCDPELQRLAEAEGLLFFHPLDRPWQQFRTSLDALGRSLADDLSSPVVRDGLLYRFARTVDLFHRLLRALLASRSISEQGFKDALTQAYQQRWIANEERWLSLVQGRFWADRAFDDERISPLVEKIPRHYTLLLAAAANLRGLFGLS